MRRVRQKDTKPEKIVRKVLWATGARYRLNVRQLPGSPDIVNQKQLRAIFVHGCFWHGHEGCRRGRVPTRNRTFWEEKFRRNRARDARKISELKRMGYRVLVVWECQLDDIEALEHRLRNFWFS